MSVLIDTLSYCLCTVKWKVFKISSDSCSGSLPEKKVCVPHVPHVNAVYMCDRMEIKGMDRAIFKFISAITF